MGERERTFFLGLERERDLLRVLDDDLLLRFGDFDLDRDLFLDFDLCLCLLCLCFEVEAVDLA